MGGRPVSGGHPAVNAQVKQRSQAAQAGRDGAAELVAVGFTTNATRTGGLLSCEQSRSGHRSTHSFCRAVKLPRLDGMVPLSWLV